MTKPILTCALCGKSYIGRIRTRHLQESHQISVAEYEAMGHDAGNKGPAIGPRHPKWKSGKFVIKPKPEPTDTNTITCALCGLVCSMQVSASHLRAAHQMTTKEYRALGHETLSADRIEQLRNTPVGNGEAKGVRGMYGADHWNWQGGHTNGQGYKIVYNKGKRVVEHRVVAEQMIGRPLLSTEVVHHIDGNRANNDPSNLQVMTKEEHDNTTKSSVRKSHGIDPDCIRAAHALYSLGWNKAAIARALRTEPGAVAIWLES
jgi:HNH endonuclease